MFYCDRCAVTLRFHSPEQSGHLVAADAKKKTSRAGDLDDEVLSQAPFAEHSTAAKRNSPKLPPFHLCDDRPSWLDGDAVAMNRQLFCEIALVGFDLDTREYSRLD